ncbi:MAG: hypothetical protein ACK5AZ_23105 [Bryobacteraceae bacterium]
MGIGLVEHAEHIVLRRLAFDRDDVADFEVAGDEGVINAVLAAAVVIGLDSTSSEAIGTPRRAAHIEYPMARQPPSAARA